MVSLNSKENVKSAVKYCLINWYTLNKPVKNISAPAEINCFLVWVINDDESPFMNGFSMTLYNTIKLTSKPKEMII